MIITTLLPWFCSDTRRIQLRKLPQLVQPTIASSEEKNSDFCLQFICCTILYFVFMTSTQKEWLIRTGPSYRIIISSIWESYVPFIKIFTRCNMHQLAANIHKPRMNIPIMELLLANGIPSSSIRQSDKPLKAVFTTVQASKTYVKD